MTHPNHESESNPMTDTENNYVEITDLLLMVPFSFYRSYKGFSINLRPFFYNRSMTNMLAKCVL